MKNADTKAAKLPYYAQLQSDIPASEIADKTTTSIAAGQLPPDPLVPDPIIAKEFYITLMGLYRWTHDAKLGFPPPIKIRNRNFRVSAERASPLTTLEPGSAGSRAIKEKTDEH